MIVTIDGPAGAGKSSIAKIAADRLGFEFLDTGALYRAMTLAAIRAQVDFSDTQEIIRFSSTVDIQWDGQRVLLKGEDVAAQIRTPPVTDAIRFVADLRKFGHAYPRFNGKFLPDAIWSRKAVTRVLRYSPMPNAKSSSLRHQRNARRRHQQLADMGRPVPLEEI